MRLQLDTTGVEDDGELRLVMIAETARDRAHAAHRDADVGTRREQYIGQGTGRCKGGVLVLSLVSGVAARSP